MKYAEYDLFLFAGESSGDVHGAHLIEALLSINPQLKIVAVAGPNMRKHPIECLMKMENFQTMGFIDVLKHLGKFIRLFLHLKKILLRTPISTCVFIDYPGFTLRLEKALRKEGFRGKLIHYISPTIWAWNKSRLKIMKQSLDQVLCILPFEPPLYKTYNLLAQYVGHPLTQQIPPFHFVEKKETVIGLFPGSRTKEIERNFPYQLQVAKKLLQKRKDLSFVISLSQQEKEKMLKKILQDLLTEEEQQYFSIFPGSDNYTIMPTLTCAIAVSGTITLELALLQVPTCVIYAIKPLDLFIAKHILRIRLDHYCLVNIIADKTIFLEFYGPNLTKKNLYHAINNYLKNPHLLKACKTECGRIKNILGNQDASQEAAHCILQNHLFFSQ